MLAGAWFVLLVGCLPGFGQTNVEWNALKTEMEQLKAGQAAIQKDLQLIKELLQPKRPEPFKEAILNIDGAWALGDPDARVTIVEFSDYQCPFCGRNFQQTMPQVVANYVKTGKVKYVFRNFPLETIHPGAFKAAEAARCAGEQGKFWEMHDQLFSHQTSLEPKNLVDYAKGLALDLSKFQTCLNDGTQTGQIRQDLTDGQNAGVRGTPAFFFGLTDPESSKLKAVKMVGGAQPYTVFREAIEDLLSQNSRATR